MDQDDFNIGVVMGVVISAIFLLVVWHALESHCQNKHNVSDCMLKAEPFTPSLKD